MKRFDNIVDIATVIQEAMLEYIKDNPENISEHKIREYALIKTMKFTKGKCNPTCIQQLICLEKSVYQNSEILFKGLLEC